MNFDEMRRLFVYWRDLIARHVAQPFHEESLRAGEFKTVLYVYNRFFLPGSHYDISTLSSRFSSLITTSQFSQKNTRLFFSVPITFV
jgi:hypothetical protein